MKIETIHTFVLGAALSLALVQAACASEDGSAPNARSKLALAAIASPEGTQLACTSAELHPHACRSPTDGGYLLGLTEDHPPCFEGFAAVLASDVCCSPNGAARPTCRGATESFAEQWGGPAGASNRPVDPCELPEELTAAIRASCEASGAASDPGSVCSSLCDRR